MTEKTSNQLITEALWDAYAWAEGIENELERRTVLIDLNFFRALPTVDKAVTAHKATLERAGQPVTAYEIALAELGVKEVPGPGSNPRILEYQKIYGLSGDAIPWCSCFMGWCQKEAGIDIKGTTPSARSWMNWGVATEPEIGCVVVLWRGKPDGRQGHVGFLHEISETHVTLLGGNQSDAVSIAKFPISRVLGYRSEVEEVKLGRL